MRQAVRAAVLSTLVSATAVEMDKQFCFGAFGVDLAESAVPSGSIIVDARVLYKHKADNRETCRIAAMGDRLHPLPGSQTFASVASDYAKFFILALMQAYSATTSVPLIISDCDVVGSFLHIP